MLYFPFAAKYSVTAWFGSQPASSAFSQRAEMSESDFTYFTPFSVQTSCGQLHSGAVVSHKYKCNFFFF